MKSLKKHSLTGFLTICTLILTGCGTSYFSSRLDNPVIEDDPISSLFEHNESPQVSTFATTASHRMVILQKLPPNYNTDPDKPRLETCAEPSPDVGEALTSAIVNSIKASGGNGSISAEAADQYAHEVATEIAPLVYRTQGLQLYRNAIHGLCIDRLNGWNATKKEEENTYKEYLDMVKYVCHYRPPASTDKDDPCNSLLDPHFTGKTPVFINGTTVITSSNKDQKSLQQETPDTTTPSLKKPVKKTEADDKSKANNNQKSTSDTVTQNTQTVTEFKTPEPTMAASYAAMRKYYFDKAVQLIASELPLMSEAQKAYYNNVKAGHSDLKIGDITKLLEAAKTSTAKCSDNQPANFCSDKSSPTGNPPSCPSGLPEFCSDGQKSK